ncbi:hypothetical protein ACSSV6_003328 [Roseovarius sp. MBR-38]|jgi:hypothetical protein
MSKQPSRLRRWAVAYLKFSLAMNALAAVAASLYLFFWPG